MVVALFEHESQFSRGSVDALQNWSHGNATDDEEHS
jgi:hypothetical protein